MNTYKGRYFDGKTSRAVEVTITNDDANIYLNAEGITKKWPLAEITQEDCTRQFLSIRFGSAFPYEQLDSTDKAFIDTWLKLNNKSGFRHLHSATGFLAVLLLFVLSIFVLGYAYGLPWLAGVVANKVPISYEVTLGENALKGMLAESKTNELKSKQLNLFFKQLHIQSDYSIKIYYVNEEVVNAFALPGGNIVVYDGLVKKLKNENELAALLAHEFTHVQKRHATRNIFRNMAGYILISALTGDMNGLTQQFILTADNLGTLSYSRELETEADDYGMQVLKENNLSCAGMKSLFETFKEEEKIAVHELLSSHPDLDSRIERVEIFMQKNSYDIQQNDSLSYYFKQLKK
jgi:Zn-dependent protease with chaperone function